MRNLPTLHHEDARQAIKDWLEDTGVSLSKLCRKAKLNRTGISTWINGKGRDLTLSTLAKLELGAARISGKKRKDGA